MRKASIERTIELAPILRMMKSEPQDWKDVSLRLLKFLGLQELGFVLIQRRQDWKEIAQALTLSLEEDAVYCRVRKILEAFPGTLEEISEKTYFHKWTISQTLSALERGGLSFEITTAGDREGRPTKTWESQTYFD